MRSTLYPFAFAFVALAAVGCSSSSTRVVTGQLHGNSFALDNPVVLAESSDARVFVAHLASDGSFMLKLPPNVSYRLTLANSTATAGAYAAVARINWPLAAGAARWATLGDGAPLDLGGISQRGHHGAAGSSESDGVSSSGDCREDDSAKCSHDHESDCDCDHKYGDGDHCEPDGHAGDDDSSCDHDHGYDGGDSSPSPTHGGGCDGNIHGGNDGGASGSGCKLNSDCMSGLVCVDSACMPPTPVIS